MGITLLKPECDAMVRLLPDGQVALRNGERVDGATDDLDWRSPTLDGTERSYPQPVTFEWSCSEAASEAKLLVADNEAFENAWEIACDGCAAEMYNFRIGQRYYWKVTSGDDSSEIGTFVTDSLAPRLVRVPGLTNVRDVGGWVTTDGRRIRQGLIYRGSELDSHHTLLEEGRRVLLDQIGLRTDFDLRRTAEVEGRTPPLDGEADYLRIQLSAYAEFCEEAHWPTIRAVFERLTDRSLYPLYLHCWGGADRTGTLVLMIQAVLGLDDELLMQDYELTSFAIWGKRSRSSQQFVSLLDALNRYGTADEPLRVKCVRFLRTAGVPHEHLDAIRAILLEN